MVHRQDFRRDSVKQSPGFFSRWSVTWLIIMITTVLFFLFWVASKIFPDFFGLVAIQSSSVLSGNKLWTIFTSMFMHAGFFHLFVNMFSLFFLGSLTERIIGRRRYFWFYLIAGIVGSLFFVLGAFAGKFVPRGDFLFGGIDDYAVGASGAIFGLLGILAVLLPRKEIYLIVGPLVVMVVQFFIGLFVPSIIGTVDVIASILIFLMVFSMISFNPTFRKLAMPLKLPFWLAPIVAIVPLFVIGFFVKLPIGNSAHLGGLVVGLIYGGYLRSKYTKKIKLLNKAIK